MFRILSLMVAIAVPLNAEAATIFYNVTNARLVEPTYACPVGTLGTCSPHAVTIDSLEDALYLNLGGHLTVYEERGEADFAVSMFAIPGDPSETFMETYFSADRIGYGAIAVPVEITPEGITQNGDYPGGLGSAFITDDGQRNGVAVSGLVCSISDGLGSCRVTFPPLTLTSFGMSNLGGYDWTHTVSFEVARVPEPSLLALCSAAAVALGRLRLRSRRG